MKNVHAITITKEKKDEMVSEIKNYFLKPTIRIKFSKY